VSPHWDTQESVPSDSFFEARETGSGQETPSGTLRPAATQCVAIANASA
jgi:hypothetical protein